MINMIFKSHKFFVCCYIDDIIIFSKTLKNHFKHLNIIIIMNLTADQSCDHAVLKSSKHAEKSERLKKNSHLNLLYTYCSSSAVCSNYLASAASTFLDLSFLNSC